MEIITKEETILRFYNEKNIIKYLRACFLSFLKFIRKQYLKVLQFLVHAY